LAKSDDVRLGKPICLAPSDSLFTRFTDVDAATVEMEMVPPSGWWGGKDAAVALEVFVFLNLAIGYCDIGDFAKTCR